MDPSPSAFQDKIHPDGLQLSISMCPEHVQSRGEIPYNLNVRYRHSHGHEVIVKCRGVIVDWLPDCSPWRILGTHTDITDIVKKDSIIAREPFVARMSHEIRTPICAVLNECELLGVQSMTYL